jgi:N-acetylglucosaminyldiphosphoundecaprenol N-acetyl-beta-D-mannosaminyltransferase
VSAIFGVHLHELPSEARLRQICVDFLDGQRTFRIYTPNPEILLRARADRGYADVLNAADLALPDGTGVAVVESLRSWRRVRRWPGVEIGALLLELAAERGATVARWRARLPGLRVEVVGAGLPVDDDGRARPDERDAQIAEEIRAVAPAIVLVGLGAPKQERWIARHDGQFPSVRIAIGIGGAFDMWAGRLRRAPRFLHRIGLEWVWRLVLEPGRLPRIVRATVVFPFRALTDRAS